MVSANPQTRRGACSSSRSIRSATASARSRRCRRSGARSRRPSGYRDDDGTEVFLSLVDLSVAAGPAGCGRAHGAHHLHQPRPARRACRSATKPAISSWKAPCRSKRIVALIKPTDTLRPPVGEGLAVAADLAALAQLPVAGGRGARGACRRSCACTISPAPRIRRSRSRAWWRLNSKRHFARVVSEDGVAFARGTQVEMEFDEEQFVGGGVYLFAAVLERFLGLYVSMNSFSQLARADAAEEGDSQAVATAGRTEDTAVTTRTRRRRSAGRSRRCSTASPTASSSSRPCACWRAWRPDRQVVGRFSNPARRSGALRVVSLRWRFPPARSRRWSAAVDGPGAMRVNFMGLTGPSGVLPLVYSELVIDRLRERDRTLRDFLDIFNHRMISLFYQAWEKYRFFVPYERGERDRFSHHVLALLGLGHARAAGPAGRSRRFAVVLQRPALAARALGDGPAPGARGLFRRAGGDRAVRGRLVSGRRPKRSARLSEDRAYSEQLGLRRGGGRRDLGPAVAHPHSTRSADDGAVYGVPSGRRRLPARSGADEILRRRTSTMWRSSWCCGAKKCRVCELNDEETRPAAGLDHWVKSAPFQARSRRNDFGVMNSRTRSWRRILNGNRVLKAIVSRRLNDTTRKALEDAAGLCLSRTHYNVEIEHFLMKLLDATESRFRRAS